MEKPLMNDEIQTLRKQLQQLQELHGSGALDDAQYQQSKERLERKLVDAVVQAPAGAAAAAPKAAAPAPAPAPAQAQAAASSLPAAPPERRPSVQLLAGVATFVVLVTVAGYAWKGSPDKLALGPGSGGAASAHAAGSASGADGAPHDTNTEQIAAMVDKLAARMKERPDDAQGWVMLARSYTVLERYSDAVPAYAQAVKLVADDPSLLADYADALGMHNNKVLGPDAMQLIERALTIDASHLKALSLAGSAAFAKKDYATAVSYWERLAQAAPAESQFLPDVRSGIAEARELGKLGSGPVAMPAVAAAAPLKVAQAAPPAGGSTGGAGASPAVANATVSGTVSLSKAMAAQASPNDTVFIFARAADGPRMPLAILRKQVKDLPLEFKLDDSLAMSPAMKLSSFPKVVVGARVSKSGEAMPQKGDLTGTSAPVATGSSGVKIEINQVLNP